MTKHLPIQQPFYTDLERSGATPVQFLPSTQLSWRAPIMARDGLVAKATLKPSDDTVIASKQNRASV